MGIHSSVNCQIYRPRPTTHKLPCLALAIDQFSFVTDNGIRYSRSEFACCTEQFLLVFLLPQLYQISNALPYVHAAGSCCSCSHTTSCLMASFQAFILAPRHCDSY